MKNYLSAVVVLIMMSLANAAFASCPVKPSIEDAAKDAAVIFIGTVAKITPAQIAGASYSVPAEKPEWQLEMEKIDHVTFSVREAFKGVSSETIDIATGADGFAGYKFEGGTWLKEGQMYLVYAYRRELAGTVPGHLTEENYGKIAAELRAIHMAFPKKLAAEINDFNSKLSPYDANVCGRTTPFSNAAEEVERIRKLFPKQSSLPLKSPPNNSLNLTPRRHPYSLLY